ncbi:MAG TPA: DUF2442 domain-containing protein [Planctomycetota bacterium]|nr:DUF2442 domain-containing protein [Planctomycetota bacterium]
MRVTRIDSVEVAGPHSLTLEFNDGLRKTVDVLPLLHGPVFEPLVDPEYFRRVLLDPVAGTVVWPDGADFAPEALRDLPAEDTPARGSANGPRPRTAPDRRH